ncbi:MAG: hypothetical protein HOW97_09485 [Catenulispora sp.]|nr:hypothetical protein [Catenulispora sp.]
MTADPLAYLHAAHAEAQTEAEAARNEAGDADWYAGDEALHARNSGQTIVNGPWGHLDERLGVYLARHDPAAVLRRITAERKQLELHATVPNHGRFSDHNACPALCDGEHDDPPVCRSCRNYAGDPIDAPCPTVEILAEGWGWTPDQ